MEAKLDFFASIIAVEKEVVQPLPPVRPERSLDSFRIVATYGPVCFRPCVGYEAACSLFDTLNYDYRRYNHRVIKSGKPWVGVQRR